MPCHVRCCVCVGPPLEGKAHDIQKVGLVMAVVMALVRVPKSPFPFRHLVFWWRPLKRQQPLDYVLQLCTKHVKDDSASGSARGTNLCATVMRQSLPFRQTCLPRVSCAAWPLICCQVSVGGKVEWGWHMAKGLRSMGRAATGTLFKRPGRQLSEHGQAHSSNDRVANYLSMGGVLGL